MFYYVITLAGSWDNTTSDDIRVVSRSEALMVMKMRLVPLRVLAI